MEQIVLIQAPASYPLELSDVKDHCHIAQNDTSSDSYLTRIIIPTVSGRAESVLRRALVTQTWELFLDAFPGMDPRYETHGYPEILLPKPPFQSIVLFQYIDTAGVTQTFVQANPDGTAPAGQYYAYQLDPGSETAPARITPAWARPFPPTRRMSRAVQCTFVAGYGELLPVGSPMSPQPMAWQPRDIPAELRSAMLMAALHLYDNRWGVDGQNLKPVPQGIDDLFAPWINYVA